MRMIFQRSEDTEAVVSVLRGVNREITYEALARQTQLDVARVKTVLVSARRILRAENGTLFGVQWGKGLRRLTDDDKVTKPEAFKRRVARGARRELHDLGTIANFERLPPASQHAVTTNRTILNFMQQQAKVVPDVPKAKIAVSPLPDISRLINKRKRK